jgi:hypothetical protein
LRVVDGDAVAQGEALITLHNPEMDVEIEKTRSERRHTQEMLTAIRDQIYTSRDLDEGAGRSLRKERTSQEQKLRSLETQLAILETQRKKLSVISPLDGHVTTWDLAHRLGQRPVEPGQHLLTVANERGPWELELRVPDRLTGYLHRVAAPSVPCQNASPVQVDFVMASNPGQTLHGTIRSIANANTFDDDEGSVLRVYVDVDPKDKQWMEQAKSGTEAIAHIRIGTRSLGYAVFYEFFDWAKQQWFKYT